MNPNRYPLISIITVVYNCKDDLEMTIKSIIDQTYPNIEYIVIDGNSNDGTIDIIKKYQNKKRNIVDNPIIYRSFDNGI